jgi:hypothetical protein
MPLEGALSLPDACAGKKRHATVKSAKTRFFTLTTPQRNILRVNVARTSVGEPKKVGNADIYLLGLSLKLAAAGYCCMEEFFECNFPFRAADNQRFKKAVKLSIAAGSGYNPSGRKMVAGTLLTNCYSKFEIKSVSAFGDGRQLN